MFRDRVLADRYRKSGAKARLYVFLLAASFFGIYKLFTAVFPDEPRLQNGDIIFQSSQSPQCDAVRLATHSVYSHCGMIWLKNNSMYVYEAVGPVKFTPFREWIKHGKDSKYLVKRLKAGLSDAAFTKMTEAGKKYEGADYDLYFSWTDQRIYCSELVWKMYKKGADIEVGKLQKLKEFDLSSKPVKEIMRQRYGSAIPYEEECISPQSIAESDLLETVANTY
jgi:hypothetical protein